MCFLFAGSDSRVSGCSGHAHVYGGVQVHACIRERVQVSG